GGGGRGEGGGGGGWVLGLNSPRKQTETSPASTAGLVLLPHSVGQTKGSVLLLHFKLGINHVVLAARRAGLAVARRCRARAGARRTGAGTRPLQVLHHRVRRLVQVADRLPDRVHVLARRRLLHLGEGRINRGSIPCRPLFGVVLQQLLQLVDHLVRLVAGVDQLAFLLVLLGVRLGLLAHPLDVRRAEAARRLDADLLLLAGLLVLGTDVQ